MTRPLAVPRILIYDDDATPVLHVSPRLSEKQTATGENTDGCYREQLRATECEKSKMVGGANRKIKAGAVLGKNIWGPGPSSFGRQQRLSKITIEPITSTIEPGLSRATAGPGESILVGPYRNLIPTETSRQLSSGKTSQALPLR